MAKLPKRMYWQGDFWNRNFILNDVEGNPIGGIKFKLFSFDADAHLDGKSYLFDVKGFIRRYADIYDDNGQLCGIITFKWNSKLAELKLSNGKVFKWNKIGFWGREWNVIRDFEDSIYDPITLSYTETEWFSNKAGRINNEEIMEDEEAIVTLAGLFIAMYLKKRSRQRQG